MDESINFSELSDSVIKALHIYCEGDLEETDRMKMIDDIGRYFYDEHVEGKILSDIAEHLDEVLAGNADLGDTPYLVGAFLRLTKLDKVSNVNIGEGNWLADAINIKSGTISKWVDGISFIRDIWGDAANLYDSAKALYNNDELSGKARREALVTLFESTTNLTASALGECFGSFSKVFTIFANIYNYLLEVGVKVISYKIKQNATADIQLIMSAAPADIESKLNDFFTGDDPLQCGLTLTDLEYVYNNMANTEGYEDVLGEYTEYEFTKEMNEAFEGYGGGQSFFYKMSRIYEAMEDPWYQRVADALETTWWDVYTATLGNLVDSSYSWGENAYDFIQNSKEQITGFFKYMLKIEDNNDINGSDGDDYIMGTDDDEAIYGGDGDDHLHGLAGNDTIYGGSGNDYIWGDEDHDTLYGEDGDDYLNGGNGSDTIYGGVGNDRIIGGVGIDEIHGDDGDDFIDGGMNSDRLYGGKGNDLIYGGDKDDYIEGGSGNDFISGDEGDDTIYGGSGSDMIIGGSGDDIIYGGTEKDEKHGDNDFIYGGEGNDWIYGGAGDDTIDGEDDDDVIFGGIGNDSINGGFGDDRIYGQDGNDTIYGDFGDDLIEGGDGYDKLYGGSGNDILRGGKGGDVLDGGKGDDKLVGGEGYDTYVFSKGYGHDTIYDIYDASKIVFNDIDLSDLSFGVSAENPRNFVFTINSTGDTLTLLGYKDMKKGIRINFSGETEKYYTLEGENGVFSLEEHETRSYNGILISTTAEGYSSLLEKVRNDATEDNADSYERATQVQPPRDPLVIDFGHTGIELTDVENGVYFDLDNNGFAEKTGWIGSEDGFLVFNRDGNPNITNGSELFSDQVVFEDGTRSTSGFEVLRRFDSNHDGVIDENDALFSELRVWIDKNHDGNSVGELHTLEELGIVSISTDYHTVTSENENDTDEMIVAEVTLKDGTKTTISEHWFNANSADTQELNTKSMDGALTSFGNMPSLNAALAADGTGRLERLVTAFDETDSFIEKRVLTREILYFITGAEDIAPNSRGGSVDARNLHVLEAVMGVESFIGADGGTTPNSNAAPVLNQLYSDFEELYFNLISDQLTTNNYADMIVEMPDDDGNIVLDLSVITDVIDNARTLDGSAADLIFSISAFLNTYDRTYGTSYLETFKTQYAELAPEIDIMLHASLMIGTDNADTLNGTNSREIIWAGNGNDVICAASGDDIIYGGSGNDTIDAGAGNDVLRGEQGDDLLNGGAGDDTYYIGANHGNDVIRDTEGDNRIVFEDGLSLDDYDIAIDAKLGFILTNKETGETIGLPDFLTNPLNYDFTTDGISAIIGGGERTVIEGTDEEEYIKIPDGGFNVVNAGDGNDTVEGGTGIDFVYGGAGDDIIDGKDGVNVLFGEDGNDKLYDGTDGSYLNGGAGDDELYGGNGSNVLIGGAGNDIIYDGSDASYLSGGDGDDFLYGGGGADILDGGAGNDYLQGDHGGDTYVFGKGYDTDTINASSDDNTIIIHGYTANQMINTRNAHNDLIIHFGRADSTDCLIVDHFFDFNANRDIQFLFDDGTILGQYDITAKYEPIYGTDADEWLAIQNGDDGIIHAGAGNDGLSGGSGNDKLYGEAGDDTLYGNDGNDILDGGTGNDQLNGGNGEDTYIFAKGYALDTINEWGSDHSIVMLTDISSDEITVSDQWGSNLLISVNGTDDVLTISNFKWGQATYTFRFTDGAEGYVDKNTWQLVLTKQPDEIEDIEQMGAELLESLYEDNTLMSDSITKENTVITDVTESAALDDESDDISDMTDIQAMLLAENMSVFGNEDQVSDSVSITDITVDTTLTDSLLVGSLQ